MKKKIVIAAIAAVVIVGGGVWAWRAGFFAASDSEFALISDQPAMVELWNKAVETEEKIAAEPEKVSLYLDAGLNWKSIAEQMEGEETNRILFFQKSLAAYERGIDKFGQKNILFYLNAGNIAQRMGDLAKAEAYYKKAIEIAPADEMAYISLTDMYDYRLKKPKEDILPLFEAGIKIMLNPLPLVSARATYLRRIGEHEAALEDYRILNERFPGNQGFKQIIAELEELIEQQPGANQ